VTVPTPWRYAIHKLIIGGERLEEEKTEKDMIQAEQLIIACFEGRRAYELHEAWDEANQRGPRWKEKLARGVGALTPDIRARFDEEMAKLQAGRGRLRKG
jgi:hypothetical protein